MRSSRLLLSRLAIGAMTVLLMFLLSATTVRAEMWTFAANRDAGSWNGENILAIGASVVFEYYDGSDADTQNDLLRVILTNAAADADKRMEVLTAVFFDVAGSDAGTWTKISAAVASGSRALHGQTGVTIVPEITAVGGEWAFKEITDSPLPDYGISASGFDIFGKLDLFNPPANLDGPDSPNGSNFGIVPQGYDASSDSDMSVPLISYAVVFEFGNVSGLTGISNVVFQYGTDLGDPRIPDGFGKPPQVPEPTTMLALLGMTLTGVGFRVTRRMRAK